MYIVWVWCFRNFTKGEGQNIFEWNVCVCGGGGEG